MNAIWQWLMLALILPMLYTTYSTRDIPCMTFPTTSIPLCMSYYKLLKWNTKWHQLCSYFTGSLVCCSSENGPFQHKNKNITELITGFLRKLKNKAVTPKFFQWTRGDQNSMQFAHLAKVPLTTYAVKT